MTVFDNVFVPNERIFLNGEVGYSGRLVERFAGYHRQSYDGCKVEVGDVLIGATALIARMNGVEKASHIRDKIVEMIRLNETMFACGIACSALGHKTPAGNYEIDMLLANVTEIKKKDILLVARFFGPNPDILLKLHGLPDLQP